MSKRLALAVSLAALGASAAGCGSSTQASSSKSQASSNSAQKTQTPDPNAPEVNPAGDIPDNQAYVAYAPPGGGFSVKVPEGWSRITARGTVTFTDKLNAVQIASVAAQAPPTVRSARQTELRKLANTVRGFRDGRVGTVTRHAGKAVRITYLATAKPNPVTGKAGQDAVERYVFFHQGRDVVLTLSGPKAADNVDPWRIISDSVRWKR